jgi:hypothetical protein
LAFPFAALLFLLSAVLFPVLLLYGDMCYGMENVGLQYTNALGNDICTGTIGGTGTATACQVDTFSNNSLVLNAPQVALNLFGGRCDSNDAIAPMWDSFRTSIRSYPQEQVDKFLEDQESSSGSDNNLVIRPKLKQPLRVLANSAGGLLTRFVDDIGSTSLSCNSLNRMWKQVKSPMCCEVGTAVYWSIAGIYLLAFSLLCCGVPSILKARKRLVAKPWGPYASDTDPAYAKFVPLGLSAVPGVELLLPPEDVVKVGGRGEAGVGLREDEFGVVTDMPQEEMAAPGTIAAMQGSYGLGGGATSPSYMSASGASEDRHLVAGVPSSSGSHMVVGTDQVELQPMMASPVVAGGGMSRANSQHVSVAVNPALVVDAEPLPLAVQSPLPSAPPQ